MRQLPENSSPSRFHTSAGSTIDFDLQPLLDGLEPPTSIEPAVTGILLYLDEYLRVLDNNGSIPSTAATVHLARIFASS
jgi:hypothetical protein